MQLRITSQRFVRTPWRPSRAGTERDSSPELLSNGFSLFQQSGATGAKNATLEAAERAGMGDIGSLKMISEPEAAAVYTLKAIQPNHLSVGR